MRTICPNCGNETDQNYYDETEEINIRGELIPVKMRYFRCDECGDEYEVPDPAYDPLEVAYREYRTRKGMVQPEELKAFRKKYGFTQKELSDVLSMGIATLNRYENGALQSEAHDRAIKLHMQPENLRRVLEEKPHLLSQETRDRVMLLINSKREGCNGLLSEAIEQFGSYLPDLFCGNNQFDVNKLFKMMKFFSYQKQVFKTKLNKLLFYADFKHFEEYGVSISGARYAHGTYGPVPDKYDTWLAAASQWNGEINTGEIVFPEYVGEYYTSFQLDLTSLSPSEISILHEVEKFFKDFSAKQISEYSHKEKGYKETREGDIISYEYARDLQL